MKKVFLLPIICLTLTSCAAPIVIEKTSEPMSRGVYATRDALNVGNIPAAIDYNAGVVKLVPPPKVPIDVEPIIFNKEQYVIIPKQFKGMKVTVVGDADFKALVADDSQLKQQHNEATTFDNSEAVKQAAVNQDNLNKLVQLNKDLQAKLDAWNKSIFYKAYLAWTTLEWLVPISAIGLIVLVCFFPFLLPIVTTIAGTILKLAFNAIQAIFSFVSSLFSK